MRISHISWRKSHVYPELIKGFLRLSRTYQRVPLLIPNSSKDSFAYPELIKGFLCLSRTYQMVPLLIPSLSKGSFAYPKFIKGKAAKVSKGRPQSPLVASAEAKPSAAHSGKIIRTEQYETSPTGKHSLWGKSNPTMYFSSGRKVPKAHRGGQFVHAGVAAPDPRILIPCARTHGAPR